MCYRKSNMKGQSMKRLLVVVVVGLAVLTGGVAIRGDCGAIPYVWTLARVVQVFEPNQNAVIAWNGQEEILVLSTNLLASEPTKVLEVIPFPSKPAVKAGDMKTFSKATEIINAWEKAHPKRVWIPEGTGGPGTAGSGGFEREIVKPAAEIVFHKQIGASEINVVHVLEQEKFVQWVEKFLHGQDVKEVKIPDVLKKSITEYLQDGCEWFAFNVVSLGTEAKSKTAVEYRFASNCLYYPLRISRTDSGNTEISLLILTRDVLTPRQFCGVPLTKIQRPGDDVPVKPDQLRDLHADIFHLMGQRATTLRIWKLNGDLGSFDHDLVVGPPCRFTLTSQRIPGKTYGPFELTDGATVELGGKKFTLKLYPDVRDDKERFLLTENGAWRSLWNNFDVGATLNIFGDQYKIGLAGVPIGTKTPAPK